MEWTGARSSGGYGELKHEGKRWAVHRLSYELNVAPIKKGLIVIHLCDNPRCVNPDHLAMATHKANMADMKIKGRAPHGSKHPASKLTPEDVATIREFSSKGMSNSALAKRFGVAPCTISKVVTGYSYRREHVAE